MKLHPIIILSLLLAIFLLRLPPIYFTGIKTIFLTTHVLSVIIIFSLSLFAGFNVLKSKNPIRGLNTESILLVIFILTQTLSVIAATHMSDFVQRHVKILIGILVFLDVKFLRQKAKDPEAFDSSIIKILFLGGVISIGLQYFMYLFSGFYFKLADLFIYANVIDITKANYFVGKLFDDTYLEVIVPIIVYLLVKNSRSQKLKQLLLFFCFF